MRRGRWNVPRRFGEERRFGSERFRQRSRHLRQVAPWVAPPFAVRDAHEPAPVDARVSWLDDHVARRGDVADGLRVRERLGEEHLERDVVLDALVVDRDGSLGAEEVDGPAVVVRERFVADAQRRVPLRGTSWKLSGQRGYGNERAATRPRFVLGLTALSIEWREVAPRRPPTAGP